MKKVITVIVISVFTIFTIFAIRSQANKEIEGEDDGYVEIHSLKNWPWRGITIVTHSNIEDVTEEAIGHLANDGVNFVRLRLSIREGKYPIEWSLAKKKSKVFQDASQIINWCNDNGIVVLISHSSFPIEKSLGIKQTDAAFWGNKKLLNNSIVFAKEIVQNFDHFDNVIGYEFFAEPVISENKTSKVPKNWNTHFSNLLSVIREVSNKYVVYTPGPWGGPKGYHAMERPILDDKILYNFHFYQPHKYTHQKIKGKQETYNYPDFIGLRNINKKFIENQVEIAANWAQQNKVPMFVGEFSVTDKAPDKIAYLTDLLETLEKNELSYAYFSFNGWKGWSYPFESYSDTLKNEHPTLTLLKEYWSKNKDNVD